MLMASLIRYEERSTLDFQIRLANATVDLERLGRRITYQTLHGVPPHANTSVWKCALGRENDASNKAKLAFSKADFVSVLEHNPAFVQRLCTVYIQDYLCLGFALPPECEGGRELHQWPHPRRSGRRGAPVSAVAAPAAMQAAVAGDVPYMQGTTGWRTSQ